MNSFNMSEREMIHVFTCIYHFYSWHPGVLDRQEFKEVMNGLKLSEREMMQVFMEADTDESGLLDYEEFLPFMVQGL